MIITSVHVWNDTRIFFKEAVSLALKHFAVVLVGISNENKTFYHKGVKIYTMKRTGRLIRWISWFTIFKLALREKSEIIHFHDPELIPLGIFLKLIKKRVIFDVHEDFAKQLSDKEWLPKFVRTMLSAIYKQTERFAPKIFDKVILAEDSYLGNFSTSHNISIIHNYTKIPREYKIDYKFDSFKMIYVGDIRIIRGIREYIKIVETSLKNGLDVHLFVVGSFAEESLQREIKIEINRKGLESNIKFWGRIPNEEIYPIMRMCDIGLALLHPVRNYLNSYPTKLFEYMSVGLPVLASKFELWEHIIIQNECGRCVDPFDVNRACEVVKGYYDSEDLRKRHGSNGRKAVGIKYNWDNEAQLLYNIYSSLLRPEASRGNELHTQ